MTKRYSILQKKLRELEAQIDNVLSLPSDSPCHQLHCEDIEQRLGFVKGLLSAEIASHPSKPHHLTHISQRLKELETAFRDWDTSTFASVPDHVDDHEDHASTCSCTESCLNDDGDAQNTEGGSEDSVELPVVVFGSDHGLVEEEEKKGEEGSKIINGEVDECERDGKREERERQGGVGRLCGAVATGVVIGMVASMVISFSQGYFQYGQPGNFLTPT